MRLKRRSVGRSVTNKIEALDQVGALYGELNHLVCEWDPYGLSERGEIDDEFSYEVWQVLYGLRRVADEDGAVTLVTTTFAQAFSPDQFTREKCAPFGKTVWEWWRLKS